jgi:uncharacterized membrane protein
MADLESAPDPTPPETLVDLSRMNGLSDGVFAIALTLLVLEIRLPEEALAGELSTRVLALIPRFLVYLISFIVIGGAWGSHQRILSQIKRGDGLLVWFNLFSLLFVTLVPASAAVLGRYPDTYLAIALFAINVILIQLTSLWLWLHASRHGLINPKLDPRVVTGISRRLRLSAFAFGFSIPFVFLNVYVVYLLWIGLFILIFATDWLSWQHAISTREASIPLNGATSAKVRVTASASRLLINAGTMENVLLSGVFGGGLRAQIDRAGELIDVQVSTSKIQGFMSSRFPWAWGTSSPINDWTIGMNSQIPIAFSVELAACEANLELNELRVTELNVKTSVSSMNISLSGQAGQSVVTIEASTASLQIRVPPELEARILHTGKSSHAEIDLDRFLVIEDQREYRSANYDTAENRVDIHVNASLGSIEIV